MTQKKFILSLLEKNKSAVFIASLGTICYDLEEAIKDIDFKGESHFIRGAMGCAIGIGLGYALSSKRKVIVLIGDGSFLMKMGSVATVLKYNLKNLKIYIMQNNTYASTGNQEINFKYIKKYLPK